jgi:ADP-dependent NAD(P)H-hydrate dehydratase
VADLGRCSELRIVDDGRLRAWPLPMPGEDGDKEERGRMLVVAGSREMPGAALLAADAAFRSGAGKVTIAIGASVAHAIAVAVPEARVIGLAETDGGGIAAASHDLIAQAAENADAVLFGPGMQDTASVCVCVLALLPRLSHARVVLDAAAMDVVRAPSAGAPCLERFDVPVLLTPHVGEMAHLTGMDKDEIGREACGVALAAARRWNALVALKGATTCIAHPEGRVWRHDGGDIGLAVSGSGDTLAGIITGLAARGATLEQACAWGVALHARAGRRLAARVGPLGYLAREIAGEVPALMRELASA